MVSFPSISWTTVSHLGGGKTRQEPESDGVNFSVRAETDPVLRNHVPEVRAEVVGRTHVARSDVNPDGPAGRSARAWTRAISFIDNLSDAHWRRIDECARRERVECLRWVISPAFRNSLSE